jgi:peptidoglycan DL-endopeptidase CwlO
MSPPRPILVSLLARVSAIAAVAAAVALLPTAAPVDARPAQDLGSLRAQATQVRAELARLDEEAGAAVERYNQVRVELDQANVRLSAARRDLARTQSRLDEAMLILGDRLRLIYKAEETGLLDVVFAADDFSDLVTQVEAIERVHGADAAAVADLTALTEQLEALNVAGEEERAAVLQREMALRESQADIEDELAGRTALLDSLDRRITELLRREARREAAAARRMAREAGVDIEGINGSAAQVALVGETMKYLGIPYVWGGASPSQGFDCSGLVTYVYRKFGVDLLHGATLQARSGTPVPLDRMEPADLVFFGDTSFYRHVGIYIGNGLFIEAPHTGDVVKISKLAGRGCALACRYPIRLP